MTTKTDFLSAQDVAQKLGIPTSTVYHWAQHKEGPPSVKLGRHRRFPREQFEAWIETLKGNAR